MTVSERTQVPARGVAFQNASIVFNLVGYTRAAVVALVCEFRI